ncbi:MAG TPA: integrase core domain-containing protein [Pirellulaceae bacterium]|jgi:transposase InsO family protein|nr:integrase core domain-containing protein [Pirellulaceae bacterium]
MTFVLQPWQLYVVILAGWIHRQQQEVIEYLRTENQVLKEKIGKKRILLNDDQRRRLATKGKILGRKRLEEVGTLFTPDTILRWHRMLVAKKYDYSERRQKVGRPVLSEEIVQLVLQIARDNPSWGYDRIAGALRNLDHSVSDQSVGNILKDHGIEPAPTRERSTSWSTFIKAHWDVLAAIDFTTIEVWTKGGLVTFYVLFVMELKSRRVNFAGSTVSPNEVWMKQIARNLTDCEDGFLNGKRYLLMDRDGKFCPAFKDFLENEGVNPVPLPPKSPNLNAHLERFFGSLKSECLRRIIFFGEQSLRKAVQEFVRHYHEERNHQGLENKIIDPGDEVGQVAGSIASHERLGGILRYYYRDAA